MIITEAIRQAQSEHVVFFLLAAYVETLGHADCYGIPEKVKRLPIGTRTDVGERLGIMREVLGQVGRGLSQDVIEEAADVFSIASEQLRRLPRESIGVYGPSAGKTS